MSFLWAAVMNYKTNALLEMILKFSAHKTSPPSSYRDEEYLYKLLFPYLTFLPTGGLSHTSAALTVHESLNILIYSEFWSYMSFV